MFPDSRKIVSKAWKHKFPRRNGLETKPGDPGFGLEVKELTHAAIWKQFFRKSSTSCSPEAEFEYRKARWYKELTQLKGEVAEWLKAAVC